MIKNQITPMEKIDLKKLTDEERRKLIENFSGSEEINLKELTTEEKKIVIDRLYGFINRFAPEVTAEDFKRRKNASVSNW